jgi:phage tail-like protein
MALPDLDSSVGHSFGLEVDGVVIKQIIEVSVKKLPGRQKAGEVTLTRGLSHDSSFESWIRDSQFGRVPDARKGGAIIVFDYEGAAIRRYTLINTRLKTLGRGTRKVGDTNILTETLILTHEGCQAGEA